MAAWQLPHSTARTGPATASFGIIIKTWAALPTYAQGTVRLAETGALTRWAEDEARQTTAERAVQPITAATAAGSSAMFATTREAIAAS